MSRGIAIYLESSESAVFEEVSQRLILPVVGWLDVISKRYARSRDRSSLESVPVNSLAMLDDHTAM